MNARHNAESCFFNDVIEEDFLFSFLDKSKRVLEWGSGYSTIAIAERCAEVQSIEHDKAWVDKMADSIPGNAKVHYVKRNSEEAPGDDGTMENYYNYVLFAKTLGKFDVILVDGRARVQCAKLAVKLLNEGGTILIHDYNNPNPACDRPEYKVVEQFLKPIGQVYALAAFKPI